MKIGDKVKLLEGTGEFSDDFKKGEILEIVADFKFGYRCRSASGKERVINSSSLVLYPIPPSEIFKLKHGGKRANSGRKKSFDTNTYLTTVKVSHEAVKAIKLHYGSLGNALRYAVEQISKDGAPPSEIFRAK